MLRFGSRLANDVQRILEWDLLVWTGPVENGNRRAERFEIQEMQREFQILQEQLNLRSFHVRFTADDCCPLNYLLGRQRIIVRNFSDLQNVPCQQVPPPSLIVVIKLGDIFRRQERPAMVLQFTDAGNFTRLSAGLVGFCANSVEGFLEASMSLAKVAVRHGFEP